MYILVATVHTEYKPILLKMFHSAVQKSRFRKRYLNRTNFRQADISVHFRTILESHDAAL